MASGDRAGRCGKVDESEKPCYTGESEQLKHREKVAPWEGSLEIVDAEGHEVEATW
jgi:hypothetical protein